MRGLRLSSGPLLACVGVVACGEASSETLLGEYEQTYTEVRDCRRSGDHQLNYVRMLTDEAATPVYQDRSGDFPEGSVVLKEEYDPSDTTCEGPIQRWTRMVRLAPEDGARDLGWHWQTFDEARREVETEVRSCTVCHSGCGVPPDGYQGTCALP